MVSTSIPRVLRFLASAALLAALTLPLSLVATSCEDAVKKNVERAESTKKKASNQEANTNLRAIASGAQIYFNEEHPSRDGTTATSNSFPTVRHSVCSAERGDAEAKTKWNQEPWTSLRFAISGNHSFIYCYDAAENGKSFAAWAERGETALCVTGTMRSGMVVIDGPRTLGPEDDCMW